MRSLLIAKLTGATIAGGNGFTTSWIHETHEAEDLGSRGLEFTVNMTKQTWKRTQWKRTTIIRTTMKRSREKAAAIEGSVGNG